MRKMKVKNQLAFALVLLFAAMFIPEMQGCSVVERTEDWCRGGAHIWLGGSIQQSTYKAGPTNTYTISRDVNELNWWCGYKSKERVAWKFKADRIRVNFLASGRIKWEFLLCTLPTGCSVIKPPERTSDKCRGGGHLWLEGGINRSVPKGSSTSFIRVSRHMRDLRWFCGYISEERVAWSGGSNLMRVHFESDGDINWEFFTCRPPPECYNTNHPSSVQISLEKLTLDSKPTDKVILGLEFLFGKPADEIIANLESKYCYARSKAREIKQGMTLDYPNDLVTLKSFRDEPIRFWLSEEDFGKDDLSEVVTIPEEKMREIRMTLDKNAQLELKYSVTVEGKNIFQEYKWLGFIADNLCISALDFATGPWTGFGRKLAINLAAKKAIGHFPSKTIGKLYETISTLYRQREFFKAVMTYQFREGIRSVGKGVGKNMLHNLLEEMKKFVLSKTRLDDLNREIKKLVEEAVRKGIIEAGGASILKIYDEINKQLDKFASWITKLTDAVEFCLSDILPNETPALYKAYFILKKS